MGFFSFFSKKVNQSDASKSKTNIETQQLEPMSYEDQIKVFNSLGYTFNEGVTKAMILRDVYEMTWQDETEKHIEENPFSILYYTFGWRAPEIPLYNYSEKCIWFDLEFFDPNTQYKWFMERMGSITEGKITYTDINILTDEEGWEWIEFKVNGIPKKWKLAKTGYIADHFIQQFSSLPNALNLKEKYTYFDNGGQQFVVDFATEKEQNEFNDKTGLKREWLGAGNH